MNAREAIERKLAECADINNAPFGLDPNEAKLYLQGKAAALQWVLEAVIGEQA